MSETLHLIGPVTPLSSSSGSYCIPDAHGRCLTCSDDAQPATVLRIDSAAGLAVVEIDGQTAEVDISLVDDVAQGQVLLVHGGIALEKLDSGADRND